MNDERRAALEAAKDRLSRAAEAADAARAEVDALLAILRVDTAKAGE